MSANVRTIPHQFEIGETVYIESIVIDKTSIVKQYKRGKVVAYRWFSKFLFFPERYSYLVDTGDSIVKVKEIHLWGHDGQDQYQTILNFNNNKNITNTLITTIPSIPITNVASVVPSLHQ